MIWSLPLPLPLIESRDGDSFLSLPLGSTALPLSPHPGSFGFVRKKHVHEGVDLYCPEGTPVYAVEGGIIVGCLPFTGEITRPRSPWWEDSFAILVEGPSGVVVYGEIVPLNLPEETIIQVGQTLGYVTRVLKKDKGRPRAMLHLELYETGTRDVYEWTVATGKTPMESKPAPLRDPTPFLQQALQFQPG
ncbi:MAG: M23 family metallopeptidase [Alphaproteobacteria bacterium]|nr:M23 family metallopeptidase [Alphaproteobacteria bacterium]